MDKKKMVLIAMLVLATVGLFDAAYLTWEHYSGEGVRCVIFEGCNTVLNNPYAIMFGLPTSLWGMIYYAGFLFLTLIYMIEKQKYALWGACALVGLGVLFSLYFVYLQLFVINAICFYCMVSATTTALLFLLSLGHSVSK
ncbi:MAG: vitamin K epoxide reductase family protein [Candidatus Niyogibacteria bacterium]|nr:vitamin K epoxide reductase family protein [Candidatus Niyogibacteria bacterium]